MAGFVGVTADTANQKAVPCSDGSARKRATKQFSVGVPGCRERGAMLRDWEGWKMRWSISFECVWREAGMSSTGSAEL